MVASPTGSGWSPTAGARFFCTAGRGLEPFLMREVRARLAATQVEYISGKVFFTTCSDLNMLKKLKSAERLFLLIKKQFPLNVSSVSKGNIFNEMQRLVNDGPESWLSAISVWKNLLELDAKKDQLSQRDANPLKRKVGENDVTNPKKLKTEPMQELQESRECQPEKQMEEEPVEQGDFLMNREKSQKAFQNEVVKAADDPSQKDLTFRVSCRCSGAIAKTFTAQEVGRVIGIALMKQFGWKADLRNPNLEIFIHLNDIYSVVGIPVFSSFLCRVPLASRAYIKTAGLRSTIAWAMASLAEIKAGAFVFDPMCGLGTILLEAAKEWPDVYYVGADVSDSQLLGAYDNLKAAGLQDKIELLKVSVTELPLPSESVDVIISDIPFGKKFKLGKDIKNILQEMERVLHVGGTIVLLLNNDHHRRLQDCEQSGIPLNSKGSPTDEPGIEKCLSPREKTDLSDTVSSSSEASSQGGLDKMPPVGSLVPVECYQVSLGRTEAFICKYRKSHSLGL
ncbi:THUMP domain-containing protein 2 isoform X1 [Mustela nigripes]|uniref:U6 snRNA (guanine-N(2))-methyltransferase THUMPD2 n=1 Tax=Mustela putorius furo TaxID=9669 RepID=A0A8U0NYX2_MUSPF|nr:THUMP domain-containing protein 2 isoform X1 [Mustela putorius furo]XP_059261503.1 THUMP domain-containing protein 2 isoform X1 [Mustela nigripes]